MRYTNWQILIISGVPCVQGELISEDQSEKIITAWAIAGWNFDGIEFPIAAEISDMGSLSFATVDAPEGKRRFQFNRWTKADFIQRVPIDKERSNRGVS